MPLPSYLILGSATSGRRGLVFNTLKNADGEGMNAVFISKSESRSEFDAKLESLSNVRLFQYEDMGRLSEKLIAAGEAGAKRAFIIADSSIPPSNAVECFKIALDSGCARLVRIWGVLDCSAAAMFPRECADYADALSHFCDCVIFTRRSGISNKTASEFSEHWRKQCKPLLCVLADKNFNIANPEELLVDEARRICMVFDDIDPIFELEIDEDKLPEEPFSLERKPDPFLERTPSGARAKPVENISKYSLIARERECKK